jgi:dolichol-phosphate mannosyltransferase
MTDLRLRSRTAAGAARFGRFGLVGLSGLAVNAAAMAAISAVGVPYLLAALLATQVSTTWNFVGAEWWAFGDRRSPGRSRRLLAFFAMNNAAFVVRGPMIWLLTEYAHLDPVVSNVMSLVVMTAARFAIADTIIWHARGAPARQTSVPAGELS